MGPTRSLRRLPPTLAALALALLLAGAPASGADAGAPQAQELRLLTYNTHGLPAWVAGDEPERRLPLIGARSNAYDVVLLQEDFAYHERLREGARQPLVVRGNPSRMPWCPICSGAGLTALIRPGAVASVVDSTARAFGVCSGWLGGASDCMATKGYLHLELRLAHGARLHVVDTHLDAGLGEADRAARARQLDVLAAALERDTAGAALVVAGDLNLDRDRPEDGALLDAFAARLGLHDARARPRPEAGWPALLDYVLLRSGAGAHLEVLEAGEDRRFVQDGRPLSDHPALFVRLRVTRLPALNGSSTSPRPPGSPPR